MCGVKWSSPGLVALASLQGHKHACMASTVQSSGPLVCCVKMSLVGVHDRCPQTLWQQMKSIVLWRAWLCVSTSIHIPAQQGPCSDVRLLMRVMPAASWRPREESQGEASPTTP